MKRPKRLFLWTFLLTLFAILTSPAAGATNRYYDQALSKYNARNYNAAIQQASQAVRIDPKHWQAWQLLGNCFYALGDKPKALTYYDYSLTLNTGNSQLSTFAGQVRREIAANSAVPIPTQEPMADKQTTRLERLRARRFSIGVEFGPPLMLGPRIGFNITPHFMATVGYSKIAMVSIYGAEVRFNILTANLRPFVAFGYHNYSVTIVPRTDMTSTLSAVNLGFGLEYAWHFGLGLSAGLHYLKAISASTEYGGVSSAISLLAVDMAVFVPNVQVRYYFGF